MYTAWPQRAHPPAWRIMAAFLIAPGLAALALATLLPTAGGMSYPLEERLTDAKFYAVGAYSIAVIVGVPAFFMLRRHVDPTSLNCSLAGAVIAVLPCLLFLPFSPTGNASINGRATVIDGSLTAYGWLTFLAVMGQLALFGGAGGLIFWLIAAARSGVRRVD